MASSSMKILPYSRYFCSFSVALAPRALLPPRTPAPWQSDDYRIGAKDLLEIAVFELPELNQTVRVSEDGSITLSLLGKVEVSGLTAQELEKKLASLLDRQYTKGAHVTVFIKEYQKVSVLGAVGKPGQYELVGPDDFAPGDRPGRRTDRPGHERDLHLPAIPGR